MKGSKYQTIKLVESTNFIQTINDLLKSTKANVSIYDNWMPKSIHYDKEAELNDFLKFNFDPIISEKITKWWLHVDATTPNWDIISTCTIKGKRGILLVEAKAHWNELKEESHGKRLKLEASIDSKNNHKKIKESIEEAKTGINKAGFNTSISIDNCYQLSNRVAHSWWLAKQGIPVVLLYLGFLNCHDMNYGNRTLFSDDKDWQNCFNDHAKQVGVDQIVDKWVDCGSSEFITICKSL